MSIYRQVARITWGRRLGLGLVSEEVSPGSPGLCTYTIEKHLPRANTHGDPSEISWLVSCIVGRVGFFRPTHESRCSSLSKRGRQGREGLEKES